MVSHGYSFTSMTNSGCQYITSVNRVSKKTGRVRRGCDVELQAVRRNAILMANEPLVVLGGRLPLIIHEKKIFPNRDEQKFKDYLQYPDRHLKTIEDRQEAIFKEYHESVLDLANHGVKVILVYPIPEIGWNVPKKLLQRYISGDRSEFEKSLKNNPVSISYETYRLRTRTSFELLDSIRHKNVFRVYPHKVFCNEELGRCYGNNDKVLYYVDTNHPSALGAELINSQITSIVKQMETKKRANADLN